MSAAKHTPGPWQYAQEYGPHIAELPRITTIARCADFVIGLPSDVPGGDYRNGDPSGDEEADARLIAAAPELLEVLQSYSLPIDMNNIGLSVIEFGSDAVQRELNRRAVIAKATTGL